MRIAVPEGSAVLDRIAFDSEVFGLEVGRLGELEPASPRSLPDLHAACVRVARDIGFAHVSRRVTPDDRTEIRALESAGYGLSDVAVLLEHDLEGVPAGGEHASAGEHVSPFHGVLVAGEADAERIASECAGIFTTSRYHHDPSFARGAEEVHRRWIRNSFRGLADVVLALEGSAAFITCAVAGDGTGNIGLLGVPPGAQRRGAGLTLVRGALAWFRPRARRVTVKTQAVNYPAVRVYERAGFRLARSELTYAQSLAETRP